MKLRFGLRLLLPILLLATAALLACAGDNNQTPPPAGLQPTIQPVEPATPLSAEELAAVQQFEDAMQGIEANWDSFYQEFDNWRSGLTSCHPSSAREALREFAASFAYVSDAAGNLPRTSVTGELADLVIAATDAEDTAFRNLRDRWQSGNVAFFEAVEQKRAESGLTHNTVVDMSLAMQEELRDGPTLDEIGEMEAFSESFDTLADAWDDFHDGYAAFARRESRIDEAEVAAGYERLLAELGEILAAIEELAVSDINEDMIERLQDAAEDELALLEFLAEFPPEFNGANGDDPEQAATPEPAAPSAPTQPTPPTPEAPQGDGDGGDADSPSAQEPDQQTPPTPEAPQGDGDYDGETAQPAGQPEQPTPPPASSPGAETAGGGGAAQEAGISPREELAATIEGTKAMLEELEQSITEFIEDDSARQLEDLQAFDDELAGFVDTWNEFYEGFADWRFSEGGCDRVAVSDDLAEFSRQASELAATVRDLPQSGPLVSVYSLAAEAAEREAGAFRTLSNSWTPFAVDVFKAVDDERANARKLRRQAGIALEELRNRQ